MNNETNNSFELIEVSRETDLSPTSGITRMFVERAEPKVPAQATSGVAFRSAGHTLQTAGIVQFFEANPHSVLGVPVVRAVTRSVSAAYEHPGWDVSTKKSGRLGSDIGNQRQLELVVAAMEADTAAPLSTTLPRKIPEGSPVEIAGENIDLAAPATVAPTNAVAESIGISL